MQISQVMTYCCRFVNANEKLKQDAYIKLSRACKTKLKYK